MSRNLFVFSPVMLVLAVGCASIPDGPSVMILPGSGQSFDQFRNDDGQCRQFAQNQLDGVSPSDASVNSAVSSAVIGTAIGALAGLAFGGGNGAVVGAGAGLLGGGLVGAGSAGDSLSSTQQRYDNSYIQCMYAKGHQVPVAGKVMSMPAQPTTAAPALTNQIPPPPPGSPPPFP